MFDVAWQGIYDNDLYEILKLHGGNDTDKSRVIGGEVALWTETVSFFSQFGSLKTKV